MAVVVPDNSYLAATALRICYVDEAGCTGALPSAASDIQPAFIICGVDLPVSALPEITREFLYLKQRFFPHLPLTTPGHFLEWILTEIKGADLRRRAVDPSHRKSRHAIGFLDKGVAILERYGARLHGRVWIKAIGQPIDGRAVYTFSLQHICKSFNHCLEAEGTHGVVVCDSRNKALNTVVSHSVFTQKFRAAGDRYPRISEMPVFGHSENHAGVQIADLVCSALLFPIAVHAYCRGHLTGTHIRDYSALKSRYAPRLDALHPHCRDPHDGRWLGVAVDDRIGKLSRGVMFSAR